MFSNKALKKLIIPLFLDQVLIITVSIIGTMMVSYAGEAAVSGLSLVDMVNMLLSNVLAAIATGGAVVVSIGSMFILRIALGYIIGIVFSMGVIGIWVAMGFDWMLRSFIYIVRFKSGRWKEFKII